jgi:hypothetical protein
MEIWKILFGKVIPQKGSGNLRMGENEGGFDFWAFRHHSMEIVEISRKSIS